MRTHQTIEDATYPIKQVIVMRTDLNMRKGKMVAQGAHASMKVILDMMSHSQTKVIGGDHEYVVTRQLHCTMVDPVELWLNGLFTKICVGVGSLTELREIYRQAQCALLPTAIITDSGFTEFKGIPTDTCCAIGPARGDRIDEITGGLKLL